MDVPYASPFYASSPFCDGSLENVIYDLCAPYVYPYVLHDRGIPHIRGVLRFCDVRHVRCADVESRKPP